MSINEPFSESASTYPEIVKSAPESGEIRVPPTSAQACSYNRYLGETWGENILKEAALDGWKKIRVLRPNDVYAMNFDTSRINFRLDENEQLVKVFVG